MQTNLFSVPLYCQREVAGDETKNMGRVRTFKGKYVNDVNLYKRWVNMKSRCLTPKAPNYKYYGGRGVKICDEWVNDFMAFFAWAKANGYRKGLSLDRTDNNGDYTPLNCRWVSRKVQAQNRRNVRMISYKGRINTLNGWASEFGTNRYYAKKILAG